MRDADTLGPWLERFLLEYIVTERNLARNTQTSYRDTFALLLPFLSGKVGKPPDRLAVRVHQNATLREEVAATVRPLDPGADRVGQGRFDDGEVVGGLLRRPIAER